MEMGDGPDSRAKLGQDRLPFTEAAGIRIPLGVLFFILGSFGQYVEGFFVSGDELSVFEIAFRKYDFEQMDLIDSIHPDKQGVSVPCEFENSQAKLPSAFRWRPSGDAAQLLILGCGLSLPGTCDDKNPGRCVHQVYPRPPIWS